MSDLTVIIAWTDRDGQARQSEPVSGGVAGAREWLERRRVALDGVPHVWPDHPAFGRPYRLIPA